MPRVSEAHKDSRRAQVVEAALACFRERGVSETTMRDILSRSGLSAGAVYSYFASRDDLILYLGEDAVVRWRASFSRLLQQREDAPGDRLKTLITEMLVALGDQEAVSEIGCDLSIWILAIHNADLRQICRKVFTTIADGFDALADQSVQGRSTSIRPYLGWTLLAHFQGLGLQASLGVPVNIERERTVLSLILDNHLGTTRPSMSRN